MTGNKIKIALCFSGEPRNDIYTFPFIYNNFLNNDKFKVDTYMHSWKDIKSLDLYKPKKCLIEYNEGKVVEDFYNDISVKDLELLDNFNWKNSILMFNSLYKCFNLIENKYDIYIRIRFDYLPKLSTNYFPYIQDIINKKYDMFIPKGNIESVQWHVKKIKEGYNDRFAISNYKGMISYCNTFLKLKQILKENPKVFSHYLLYKSLELDNIKINNYPFHDKLLREIGGITESYGEVNYF